MGLTNQSTGNQIINNDFSIKRVSEDNIIIALAGNPNVGKSTVFNSLTGLNQHTGNWPGKTVTNAQGVYTYKNKSNILVDLPGTYSLMASSVEEEVARDFICFGKPDVTVVVVDATCIERNLNLVLQTLEITDKVVVCLNLIDEAKRKAININIDDLSNALGVPVVPTNARKKEGLSDLCEAIHYVSTYSNITNNHPKKVRKTGCMHCPRSQSCSSYNNSHIYTTINPIAIMYDDDVEKAISTLKPMVDNLFENNLNSRWICLKLLEGDKKLVESINNFLGYDIINDADVFDALTYALEDLEKANISQDHLTDLIVSKLINISEDITKKTIEYGIQDYNSLDRKIDNVLTSKVFGFPIMIALLGIVFWLTITGANYPSQLLANGLFWLGDKISALLFLINCPVVIHDIIVLGIYKTLAWVVSVMLPPMAIFFPLFTLLEDLGYLPRVAFNLDNFFKKACAHGKQALTMCMGFGCNAAGVIGCRIIDSPRERLIAIITNNFVPCNGRFPSLIAVSTIFIGGVALSTGLSSLYSTLAILLVILIGIFTTFFISKMLSLTILKGVPSSFTLELPPYRKPQVGQILVRSILDRTIFVLGRAVAIAAPAGLVIWSMANIFVGDISILHHCSQFLDPIGRAIGLDGVILLAFILGLPANEIVVPIIIMTYMAEGSILELESLQAMKELLITNGWTYLTAICFMLFSLIHFPCGTTLWTIKKETQSIKWTLISFLIPTVTGFVVCFIVAQVAKLLGLG